MSPQSSMAKVSHIEKDHNRFKQIVRGQIKQDLKKYITKGELIGRKGKDTISIPVPQIDIPRFKFGQKQMGGVGQGDGEPGDPMGEGEDGSGQGQAGDQAGDHTLEVDVSLEELAEILAEELELPRIEPRGKSQLTTIFDRYRGIRRVGPESLKHFRRTYQQALKRQISSGIYNFNDPLVMPVREDKRFRSWKTVFEPNYQAVIFYLMDVSGSMGDEQKNMVRIESFWIDTWLQSQYKGLETRYIIHDATAKEVDRETFFSTKESGGTVISSAYDLTKKLLEESYPTDEWNVYLFHFSDGDNWSTDDTERCMSLLREDLLPKANLFGYGQVKSFFGSGQFIEDLRRSFPEQENMVLSEIPDKNAILKSIKEFLGKGK